MIAFTTSSPNDHVHFTPAAFTAGSLSSPMVGADGQPEPRESALMHGILEVRPGEYEVFAEGIRVGLTVREFQAFMVLFERIDRVVPRTEMYSLIWGGKMPYRDRSVDVVVRKVRNKLAEAAPGWSFVHTHFGVGYRLSPQPVPVKSGRPDSP